MRKVLISVCGILPFIAAFVVSLCLYGWYLDSRLKIDVHKVHPGMTEEEVIQVIGKPTSRGISDIPGTYWYYRTDVIHQLIDDNPDKTGYMVLEMGSDGRVEKVFDISEGIID